MGAEAGPVKDGVIGESARCYCNCMYVRGAGVHAQASNDACVCFYFRTRCCRDRRVLFLHVMSIKLI